MLQHVQDVDYPAVTLCNAKGHDTGEYVRSIFNNFVFLEELTNKSSNLKNMFQPFLDDVTEFQFKSRRLGRSFFEWAG
jgi:hypothetical protein